MEEKSPTVTMLFLEAALSYARRAIPVFPCEPGGKRPLTHNGFWDATTDEPRLRTWWRRRPSANVGVPTGKESGLLVLDVDPREGGTRSRTGGGGTHVFFRYPAEQEVRNSAGWLGPGLDVRGEGGYVVVPPSRTRSAYEWIERSPSPRRSGS